MTTALATRPSSKLAAKRAIMQQRAIGNVARRETLPEYLESTEIEALLKHAPNNRARLVMLCQWRAGLRVSEALALEVRDLNFTDNPTMWVRMGKGHKSRIVPMHGELAAALHTFLGYSDVRKGPLFTVSRSTAWRWVQQATVKATAVDLLAPGKVVGTHTLRHSAARHWLASGVPINAVSRWLGHASLQTTLVYLELLGDPMGYMERVP